MIFSHDWQRTAIEAHERLQSGRVVVNLTDDLASNSAAALEARRERLRRKNRQWWARASAEARAAGMTVRDYVAKRKAGASETAAA